MGQREGAPHPTNETGREQMKKKEGKAGKTGFQLQMKRKHRQRRSGRMEGGSAQTKRGVERYGREAGPGGTHHFSLYLH